MSSTNLEFEASLSQKAGSFDSTFEVSVREGGRGERCMSVRGEVQES